MVKLYKMWKKGDLSRHTHFKKGDMSIRNKIIGNYHSPHLVHSFIQSHDTDLKEARHSPNALEKYHK